MRFKLEVIPNGIIKHTAVYSEKLIHGTDSNKEDIMDSNINLTWCDSIEGNSSTVNLGSLCNRIDIIFARKNERVNQTLVAKLRCKVNSTTKIPWTKLLELVTYKYNNSPRDVTGFPPAYLMV
ncbi:hypothetical protein TNCV_540241 [Trichonephila clavipes]|nr:hypothetical protein TNCV_540241 [Trichonephila clavipes]